ncbi:MAG: CoA ester lyase [SAR202 cluster bacterium]|nr:CoA ester lyase [SAR202 cluster bacterium]
MSDYNKTKLRDINILRSPMFIPGNRSEMLKKALSLNPDAFIPDLEDSVNIEDKSTARKTVHDFLPLMHSAKIPVIPRINSIESGLFLDDLKAVIGPYISAISIGKINSSDDIKFIESEMANLETENQITPGHTKLIPWIETSKAVLQAFEICSSSTRIISVAFGAEDFTEDMGIQRQDDESEVEFARNFTCIAAKAANITSLDSPYFKFKDTAGLSKNCSLAAKIGFTGKFAIHPSQIDQINQTFSPSQQLINEAKNVLAAAKNASKNSHGTTSINGKLIDAPVIKRAKNLLQRAEIITQTKKNS